MPCPVDPVRRWRAARKALLLCLTCALAWAPALEAGAQGEDAAPAAGAARASDGRLWIALARIASELEPVAEGYAEWLRSRVRAEGMDVEAGARVRGVLGRTGGSDGERVAAALEAGAGGVLLFDLLVDGDDAVVAGRIYVARGGDGVLVGASRARAPRAELAATSRKVLVDVLPTVGGPDRLHRVTPVRLEHLAAGGRALAALDRGDLQRAWLELKGRVGSGTREIRAAVERAAADPATPVSARARLLVARGEPERAWHLVGRQAAASLDGEAGDVSLLLAAGEAQLGRGKTREARAFFERVLAQDSAQADAHRGLGLALTRQGDREAARRALRRAAELDPGSSRALEELANLEAAHPARRAAALFEAGERAAGQMRVREARGRFEEAVRLDPGLAAGAWQAAADVESRAGDHASAITHYARAMGAGRQDARLFSGLARSQQAEGDLRRAATSWRAAAKADPADAVARRELAGLEHRFGRTAEAEALLEEAVALDPKDGKATRLLARALHARGEVERSYALYATAVGLEDPGADPGELAEVAALQIDAGRPDAARALLERAVELDPADGSAQQQLVAVYEAVGDTEAATRQRAVAVRLGVEVLALEPTGPESPGAAGTPASSEPVGESFAAVVQSFVDAMPPDSGVERVVVLGIREPLDWKDRAREWLMPRVLDRARLDGELTAALGLAWQAAPAPEIDGLLEHRVDQAYAFEARSSLDAGAIATLNSAFASDAVVLGRLDRAPGSRCGSGPHLAVELRLLSGGAAHDAAILANSACLEGGAEAYATWNLRAGGVAGVLALLSLAFLARGFGTLVVTFRLPPKSRALFSVSLSKRPRRFRSGSAKTAEGKRWRFEQRLRSMSWRERRLNGDRVVFRWVPARRSKMYVTVRGPLLDFLTEELIGDFLEEKSVLVKRGVQEMEFDLRGQECAVEVRVQRSGSPVQTARLALQGQSDSLRYARDGRGIIHARPGEHVLVVGADDVVAERNLLIDDEQTATSISVDLSEADGLLFAGCAPAVERYLESDFEGAADALAAAGQSETAHLVRATGQRTRGRTQDAAQSLEAAGQLEQAAELRASTRDLAGSARLYEEAGEHRRAAEAYRESGDLQAAARAFEEACDYASAADCHREIGDDEKLLDMLEKSGEYLEAAEAARAAGQIDRAIHDYQQVDPRNLAYGDVCRTLAELLEEKGEVDVALEKYAEAMERGGDAVPLEARHRYARLLEGEGRIDDALSVYEGIRRRDLHYGDVATRIESLRKQRTEAAAEAATVMRESSGLVMPTSTPTSSGRYEVLDELGRGGMGVVYRARDTHLGRVVALKVLPENLREHPTAVKLFLREARASAALNHANIVTVYDAGREGDTYFISMECLEGLPVNAILQKRGALSAKDVARLGIQISAGLDYAHRNRIVHRDIKTSNLFFTRDRVVKIMDFGLAKMVEEVRRASTMIGGTPYYMAPEQAAGEAVDHRTDLYALGVTLFNLLTGAFPFTEGDITYHHRHTPAPDPRERVATIPAPLAEIVLQLMGKRPEDRPDSALEVARVCQQILR